MIPLDSLNPLIAFAVITVACACYAIGYDAGHRRAWRDAANAYEREPAPFVSALRRAVD